MDYKQLISEKYSVRDYKDKKVNEKALEELKKYSESCPRLVHGITMDIHFMDHQEVYPQLNGSAGYHGILINAPHYVILLSEEQEYYRENAGYVGEGISLKAFELGIDSCWITFSDSKTVLEKLNITSEKTVVGILALGYGKKKTSGILGALKTGDNYTQANIRKKEEESVILPLEDMVFINKWGEGADVNTLLERALYDPMDCARKAPSTLNRQPWRFIVDGGKIILTVRKDEAVNDYEQAIDSGIAMLYFDKVIEQTLVKVHWTLGDVENVYHIPEEYQVIGICEA